MIQRDRERGERESERESESDRILDKLDNSLITDWSWEMSALFLEIVNSFKLMETFKLL